MLGWAELYENSQQHLSSSPHTCSTLHGLLTPVCGHTDCTGPQTSFQAGLQAVAASRPGAECFPSLRAERSVRHQAAKVLICLGFGLLLCKCLYCLGTNIKQSSENLACNVSYCDFACKNDCLLGAAKGFHLHISGTKLCRMQPIDLSGIQSPLLWILHLFLFKPRKSSFSWGKYCTQPYPLPLTTPYYTRTIWTFFFLVAGLQIITGAV